MITTHKLLARCFSKAFDKTLNLNLSQFDPEVMGIVKQEEKRQTNGLNLIAS
jgi:glycine/serine hydroxymethyltransferase